MNEGYCSFCDRLIVLNDEGKLSEHVPCSGRAFSCLGSGKESKKESVYKKWLESHSSND